jgi:hypothetical protein
MTEDEKQFQELSEKFGLTPTVISYTSKKGHVSFDMAYVQGNKGVTINAELAMSYGIPLFLDNICSKLVSVKDEFIAKARSEDVNTGDLIILFIFQIEEDKALMFSNTIKETPIDSVETFIDFWTIWIFKNKGFIVEEVKNGV